MAKTAKFDYFDALAEMSEYSVKAANYLTEAANNYNPDTILDYCTRMHEYEHAEDELKHVIMNNLIKEFLPPIEREDIIELASKLDDVTDSIDELLHQFYIYNIQSLVPECMDFISVINESTVCLNNLMKELKNFRKSKDIHDLIIAINNHEGEGDRLYTGALHKLFSCSKREPIDIIRWKEIVSTAENCCDAIEEVSEAVETIVMKNM